MGATCYAGASRRRSLSGALGIRGLTPDDAPTSVGCWVDPNTVSTAGERGLVPSEPAVPNFGVSGGIG